MKDILREWNPWWAGEHVFRGVTRKRLGDILPWINRKEIISIVGVRRSGKTTLLYEIVSHLTHNSKINPHNILFIKADDDRVAKDGLVDLAIDEYYALIDPSSKVFLFIDEIQEITNWQKTLKRIYDLRPDLKIFISGSNASLLKEDLGSFLAGRFASFEVFPFSFSEYLQAKGITVENNAFIKSKNTIRHLLLEYINLGSFPEVALEAQEKMKKGLIMFYFDSIFYRDVIKRKAIRNPAKLEKLVKYFLQNLSCLANFTRIAKLLELTTDSVVEYTRALEDAYLIFPITIFEFSYKKQIINPKKIYCVDTGMRNVIGFTFSEDIGRLYENLVFMQLKRLVKEIYYWKNTYECDFITREGKKLRAIQVCYDIRNAKERELKGLLEAMNQFKIMVGHIVTENYEAEEEIGGRKIKYVPLWKWLILNDG